MELLVVVIIQAFIFTFGLGRLVQELKELRKAFDSHLTPATKDHEDLIKLTGRVEQLEREKRWNGT